MLRPPIRYARARDGVTIAYTSVGDGPLTLAVVPGLISQVDLAWEEPAYEQFMSRLSAFARVVTLDRRGTGLSDPVTAASGRMTLHDLAFDVEAVLDATGTERAAVLGFSLGSMTAVQFAADFPRRVSAVLLIAAGAKITRSPDYPAGIDPHLLEAWADRASDDWGSGSSIEADSPAMRANQRYREWAGRLERHTCSPGIAGDMIRTAATYDVRSVLSRVRVPTLILHREHDRVSNVEQARHLAAELPDATYIELGGADHTFFLGDQRITIEAIMRFLDERIWQGGLTAVARQAARKGAYTYGWANLTPGEREVAILVAAGLTNKEIAARLRKSVHTIDGHLRRVFGKLDVSTRVGVAAEYSRIGGSPASRVS